MSENKGEKELMNPAASMLLETLENRWKTYRIELKRCRSEPSEEAVHDLRVATRRLLALLELFRDFAPHPRIQKLRRIFKNQLDDFNDLRDTQVILVEISETLDDLPELKTFQEVMLKREKNLLRRTVREIKSFKTAGVKKRMDFVYKSLVDRAGDASLANNLLQTVDEAYERVLRRYRRIDPAQPASIHRTRVAFKKFRYMVEIIHSMIPNFPVDNSKQMHEFQGLMGDIQDMEVFLFTFETISEKQTSYDPEPVRHYYQQQRAETVTRFVEEMHHVHTFWRPASDAPFPWDEKSSSRNAETDSGSLPEQEVAEKVGQPEVQKEAEE